DDDGNHYPPPNTIESPAKFTSQYGNQKETGADDHYCQKYPLGWKLSVHISIAGAEDYPPSGENYGKLLAYHFPKERLVYGPSQIENRIGQDTIITEQLALWGRGGSRVIRGNLLLIPLGGSILYVEPVFLEAETGGLPQLKRV
ncbi:unnamed protein product, partial [marine sediment metagenome]